MIERKQVRRREDREFMESYNELSQYVCPVHFSDKEETKEYRASICKQIETKADLREVDELKKNQKAFVPRWVLGILVLVLITVLGVLYSGQHDIKIEIVRGNEVLHKRISEISTTLNNVENTQINVATRLTAVEKQLEKNK